MPRTAGVTWLPVGTQESDEVYLLSGAGETVKVRAELMDIKQLLATDEFGLQQWTPVLKASFPIDRSNVERVFDALHVPVPSSIDAWTFDEFLRELTGPSRGIRAVSVHKRRVRYAPNGCSAEITDVVADGGSAGRSPSRARTRRPSRLWFARLASPTTSIPPIPRVSPASSAGTPERYAVIDCGTNSIKFHVAERTAEGGWRTLVDRAELTRLGEGIEATGAIGPAALERTVTAIEGMVEEARSLDVLAIAAVGTAGLRMASNRDTVLAAIAERTGVEVEVIPATRRAASRSRPSARAHHAARDARGARYRGGAAPS